MESSEDHNTQVYTYFDQYHTYTRQLMDLTSEFVRDLTFHMVHTKKLKNIQRLIQDLDFQQNHSASEGTRTVLGSEGGSSDFSDFLKVFLYI